MINKLLVTNKHIHCQVFICQFKPMAQAETVKKD